MEISRHETNVIITNGLIFRTNKPKEIEKTFRLVWMIPSIHYKLCRSDSKNDKKFKKNKFKLEVERRVIA